VRPSLPRCPDDLTKQGGHPLRNPPRQQLRSAHHPHDREGGEFRKPDLAEAMHGYSMPSKIRQRNLRATDRAANQNRAGNDATAD